MTQTFTPTAKRTDALHLADPALLDLVDAVVAVADASRWDEVARLRDALDPFGATVLFDAELRLNGVTTSELTCCICGLGDSAIELSEVAA